MEQLASVEAHSGEAEQVKGCIQKCRIEAEIVRRYGHDPIEDTEALLDTPFGRSATLWPFAHLL